MAIDVIGAGFGRTGTLSLKLALEQLGFEKCYHMTEVFQHPDHVGAWLQGTRGEPMDWDAIYQGYRATVDWPGCNFWELELKHYPQAKVILSQRDPKRWYQSVMNTIYPASIAARESADPAVQPWADMVFELIWEGTFHGRIEDEGHAIDVYLAHNDYVRRQTPEDQLLEFEASDGWAPLCGFLGRPVPDSPFPQVNSTEEFLARRG
jgi:hypothetical protein